MLGGYIQDVAGMRGWRMLGFGKRWECVIRWEFDKQRGKYSYVKGK